MQLVDQIITNTPSYSFFWHIGFWGGCGKIFSKCKGKCLTFSHYNSAIIHVHQILTKNIFKKVLIQNLFLQNKKKVSKVISFVIKTLKLHTNHQVWIQGFVWHLHVTSMLQSLGWPDLESRRRANDLTMFFKILSHQVNIDFPSDLEGNSN